MKSKSKLLTTILILGFLTSNAQTINLGDSTLFDFWVGDWVLSWTNKDGTKGAGTNHIVKILDGKVIQENFQDASGFKGTSISVYDGALKNWKQAWADNQGGYFDFEGAVEGDKRIFKTELHEVEGREIIQRMVFYHIQKKSFTWDWELSKDGGSTWELQWRINYRRK